MSTRHRWADVITAWANGEAIQWRTELTEVWRDWTPGDYSSTPYFHQTSIEWRIKPRMCSLNGYEFPAAERRAPERETCCWCPCPTRTDYVMGFVWQDDITDQRLLHRGRIHLTKDAAIAHARAEILAVGGTLEVDDG